MKDNGFGPNTVLDKVLQLFFDPGAMDFERMGMTVGTPGFVMTLRLGCMIQLALAFAFV